MHPKIRRFLEASESVMLDVGANQGTDSLGIAKDYPHLTVFAFEPTPALAKRLRNLATTNYNVIENAVSDCEGRHIFHISGIDDWGRSSLNTFNPSGVQSFGGVANLNIFTEEISVNCVRLDKFCELNNIKSIQYLHVDTQGSDLAVLQSLGCFLKNVDSGMVEVARTFRTRLYDKSPTRNEMAAFLHENGFQIIACLPNDVWNAEQNVIFEKALSSNKFILYLKYLRAIALGWPHGLKLRLLCRVALRTRLKRLVSLLKGIL